MTDGEAAAKVADFERVLDVLEKEVAGARAQLEEYDRKVDAVIAKMEEHRRKAEADRAAVEHQLAILDARARLFQARTARQPSGPPMIVAEGEPPR
jgi:peptidoglycan hydrolase CwlO-like protein